MVLGSPDQYWDGFYRFPSPVLGNCSKFSSAVLEMVLSFPVQHWDRFYRFPSPNTGKGSLGSPVQYWVKVVYVLKFNT